MTSGATTRATALFEQLGEPAVEVVFEHNTPRVEAVNSSFETVFGVEESAILGQCLDDIIVPDDAREGANEINRRASTGEVIEREVQRQTAEGLRTFLFRSAPFQIDGQQYGYGIYLDITKRKQREQELQRQLDRFERLASMTSHDLRNPLQVAKGRVQMASDRVESEHLETAHSALERMDSIIDDMLTLMEAGQPIEEGEPVDLADVARQGWEHVPTEDADLQIDDTLTVLGDGERLAHVFENLFQNAVKHGGTSVTVQLGTIDESGFYIEDDGSGLPEDGPTDIFETGYSTEATGSGYGLSIVKDIVEAHDWTITATDGERDGARFEITGVSPAI